MFIAAVGKPARSRGSMEDAGPRKQDGASKTEAKNEASLGLEKV